MEGVLANVCKHRVVNLRGVHQMVHRVAVGAASPAWGAPPLGGVCSRGGREQSWAASALHGASAGRRMGDGQGRWQGGTREKRPSGGGGAARAGGIGRVAGQGRRQQAVQGRRSRVGGARGSSWPSARRGRSWERERQ
jgi:hypothetical protein